MPSAVLFDMDGTMFDTEGLWGEVTKKLAESYGIEFDARVRTRMMGKKDSEALQIFRDYFSIDDSVDSLVSKRRGMILENLDAVTANPGLYDVLDLLETHTVPKAVATSSFRELADSLLQRFEVSARFDAVVTGDDVTRSKPDPMMFLEAARRLDADASRCLVIEDAQNGVEAAWNAGMRVYAIPHKDSAHHDFSKATAVLTSLKDIDESRLMF